MGLKQWLLINQPSVATVQIKDRGGEINMRISFGEWIALATLAVAVMQLVVMVG